MVALEISARQFRDKQKSFFEIADSGRQIVIRRGKKRAYFLTPVEESDFIVTPELLAKLDNIRQTVQNGKYTECKTIEELDNFLDSL
jgi:hypothetical protein